MRLQRGVRMRLQRQDRRFQHVAAQLALGAGALLHLERNRDLRVPVHFRLPERVPEGYLRITLAPDRVLAGRVYGTRDPRRHGRASGGVRGHRAVRGASKNADRRRSGNQEIAATDAMAHGGSPEGRADEMRTMCRNGNDRAGIQSMTRCGRPPPFPGAHPLTRSGRACAWAQAPACACACGRGGRMRNGFERLGTPDGSAYAPT